MNQNNFTVIFNLSNPAIFLSDDSKNFIKKAYKPRLKVKKRILESKSSGKNIFDFINTNDIRYDEKSMKRLLKSFTYTSKYDFFKSNSL
jgi:hypothetical protein